MKYPCVQLGDICEINLGKTPPRGISKFWDKEHIGDGVWLSIADMNNLENGIVYDSKEYITKEAIESFGVPFVEAGTLLLSFKLTLGRTAIAGRRLCTKKAIAALPIRNAYKSRIDIIYLKMYFSFFNWDAYASGDEKLLGKTLNKKKLDVLPIMLPPLPIQHEIVARLEKELAKVDEMAESFKRMAELADEEFKSVLSETFEHVEGKNVKLGEVCDIERGKSKHRPRNDSLLFGGSYPFIQTGDIRNANGGYITYFEQTYSDFGLAQSKLWAKGTLCITIAANIGETAILGIDACFPDSVVGLVPHNEQLLVEYLNFFFLNIKDKLSNDAPGTAQKNINIAILQDIKIVVPSKAKQSEVIAKINNAMRYRNLCTEEANNGLSLCTELRKSILQEAFA